MLYINIISKMAHRIQISWARTIALTVLLLAALVWLAGTPELKGADAQEVYDLGKRTYQIACSPCHGSNGDGNAPAAKALNPKPRDFSKGAYKFRSTFPGILPADEDLQKTISQGIPGTSMPAWKNILSEPEIDAVTQYLKGFSPFFGQVTDFDTLIFPTSPLSQEAIARGKEIYKILGCWTCHGMKGRGDGPSAKGLLDEEKRPIKAYDFTTGSMKRGSELSDIYKTLITGLRGTPMPSFYWAFRFTRENLQELLSKEIYQQYFSGSELKSLQEFIESILTEAELNALDSTGVEELMEQRKWELVQYVYSLKRHPGPLSELFIRDHELTR